MVAMSRSGDMVPVSWRFRSSFFLFLFFGFRVLDPKLFGWW